jgi:sigma-E factor negative regulatory protein RseA
MSEESNQMLSALVDGELPSAETGSVVNLTHLDLELKAKWARYHLIGEALRGGLPTHLRRDLASRVSAAVAAEPAIIAAPPAPAKVAPLRATPWLLKPAAGLAIAASVALLAVVAVQRLAVTPATPGTAQQLAAAPASEPTVTAGMELQPVDWGRNQAPEAAAAARSKMNDYLLNYSERRANWGAPGMLPYVKVVGYENDQ